MSRRAQGVGRQEHRSEASTPAAEAAKAGAPVRSEPSQPLADHPVIRIQNDDPRLHQDCGDLHPGTI